MLTTGAPMTGPVVSIVVIADVAGRPPPLAFAAATVNV